MKRLANLFLLVLLSGSLFIFCGGEKKMLKTVRDVVEVLGNHTPVVILGDENGLMMAVTPEYGGKVIALTYDGLNGKNLLWPNPKVASPEFWSGDERNWNIGGARTWLAPEADFYLDQEKNWFVPQVMDPGNYRLIEKTGNSLSCENEFEIKNVLDQPYHLKIIRDLRLLTGTNVLHSANVRFVGMEFTHKLVNLSDKTIGKDVAFAGLWSLIQLDAGGTMIIPVKKDPAHNNITVRDYGPVNFNAVPPERLARGDNWISVKIDGKFRCKLGIAPWAARGGIAYVHYAPGSQEGILYLKQFEVYPDAVYVDHPWERPYDYGDAIQLYNDDGQFGGFCEIECHGPAKMLAPNDTLQHAVRLSIFMGNLDELKKIAGEQLQIEMEQVKLF